MQGRGCEPAETGRRPSKVSAALRRSGAACREQLRLMLTAEGGTSGARREADKTGRHRLLVGLSSLLYLLPSVAYWHCGDRTGAALFALVAACSAAADGEWSARLFSVSAARRADKWTASSGGLYVFASTAALGDPLLLPVALAMGVAAACCLVSARGSPSVGEWVLWQSLWHLTSALSIVAVTVLGSLQLAGA
eukprot:TRINITY_DN21544_c0_g1_i1.p2 TRINITY_DN21544_c0_g1~~TRINITY_DN21544_c0_g1_i1.p2  ORF type:complete len:221 (+),score=51.85 TRINITY_DN21544_c0_g1_i1:82-663(+)